MRACVVVVVVAGSVSKNIIMFLEVVVVVVVVVDYNIINLAILPMPFGPSGILLRPVPTDGLELRTDRVVLVGFPSTFFAANRPRPD